MTQFKKKCVIFFQDGENALFLETPTSGGLWRPLVEERIPNIGL